MTACRRATGCKSTSGTTTIRRSRPWGGPQVCRAPSFFDQSDMASYAVKFRRLETIERIQHFEHLLTGNMSVRRAAIERIGGFDEVVAICNAVGRLL